jgi:hypothetical protein
MKQLLYITSSSYSGSTLLTFLLNQHPEIFTIGELEGWDFGDEKYHCSCGQEIGNCPFFLTIQKQFRDCGLPFRMNNFGTKLQLAKNKKINRYLTSAIPGLANTGIEHLRDEVLWHLPPFRQRYQQALRSNVCFIDSALEYSSAKTFVDATKNPFRIRLLKQMPQYDFKVLYLVRDIRGVVASNIRKKGIGTDLAVTRWLSEQDNILRILKETINPLTVHYEDLCESPGKTLAAIYEYLDLDNFQFDGNIREGEHHILGNMMRVTSINNIVLDERWKKELTLSQIKRIEEIVERYLEQNRFSSARDIITHYLEKKAN